MFRNKSYDCTLKTEYRKADKTLDCRSIKLEAKS